MDEEFIKYFLKVILLFLIFKRFIVFLIIYMYVCGKVCAHECMCPQCPEESVTSHEAVVTRCCGLSDIGPGN